MYFVSQTKAVQYAAYCFSSINDLSERWSVGRISLDQNCLFSQDRNFHYQ